MPAPARPPAPEAARRRALGAHYTPESVARRLVSVSLGDQSRLLSVCDPACGDGAFLLAAAEELADRTGAPRAAVADCLWGADVDAAAVATARSRLAEWAGTDPGERIVVADTLLSGLGAWPSAPEGGFDLVVGNPPFLGQLRSDTARGPRLTADLRRRYGDCVGSHTDTSLVFLLASLGMARSRVSLVLPTSVLVTASGTGLWHEVTRRAAMVGAWLADEQLFDASVDTWAPVLELGRSNSGELARWVGPELRPASPLAAQPPELNWSALFGDLAGLPELEPPPGGSRLGDRCSATAGFRQHYYGVAPYVTEADPPAGDAVKLVTSGMIDPAHLLWGSRPVRFARSRWSAPVVDAEALDRAGGEVAEWARRVLVPKVLVASQTRVLEVVADPDGSLWPSVPVVAVTADSDERVWHLAAAIGSPVAAALVARQGLGGGLHSGVSRVTARQLRELVLPAEGRDWDDAAEAFRAAQDAAGDLHLLAVSAAAACRAYGMDRSETERLLAWWQQLLPRARRSGP